MSSPPQSEIIATYLFGIVVGLTFLVYILRGVAVLTFIPGGIIWILILLSIGSGIFFFVEKSRRF